MPIVASGQITIADVNDGLYANLSSEAHVLSADAGGAVASFDGCATTFRVYQGGTDVTSQWSVAAAPSAGLSGSLTGTTYTVTGLAGDSGYVDFNATRAGASDLTARFSVSKAKQGASGTTGLTLSASAPSFTFIDGVASPSAQVIRIEAFKGSAGQPVVFYASGGVPLRDYSGQQDLGMFSLGVPAADGPDVRYLALEDFGSNQQVTVSASYVSADGSKVYDAALTVSRLDRSTAAAGANNTYVDSAGNLQGVSAGAGTAVDNRLQTYGVNLIPNSDYRSAITAAQGSVFNGATILTNLAYASEFWSSSYTTKGETGPRNLFVRQGAPGTGGDSAAVLDIYPVGPWDLSKSAIPVSAGARYVYSCYLQSHRCRVGLGVSFYGFDGTLLSNHETGPTDTSNGTADVLSAYTRLKIAVNAPSGATHAMVYVRKFNTWAGNSDSYIWLLAPQFEPVGALANDPGTYVPGTVNKTSHINALNKAGDDITGRINLQVADGLFAGTDMDNGVYLGSNGLVGRKAGSNTIVVGTDGNVQVAGDITGSTGTFMGKVTAGSIDVEKLSGFAQVFNSPGTFSYTTTEAYPSLTITVRGGAGGGGGGSAARRYYDGYRYLFADGKAGGRGGNGGQTIYTYTNVPAGTTFTIEVGAGGDGGAGGVSPYTSPNGQNGSSGGTSSVAGGPVNISAPGGTGGGGGTTTVTGSPGTAGGGSGTGTAGGGGVGGNGGNFATASQINDPGQPGAPGGSGSVVIEVFNPNGVILRSEWQTLITHLSQRFTSYTWP